MGCLLRSYLAHFLHFLFLLSRVICSSSFSFPSSTPLCHRDQSSALLQFKNSFSISNDCFVSDLCEDHGMTYYPKMNSWKRGKDCCAWDGITCDEITGHVIGIDLSCSGLQGAIHPNSSLFSLSHLQKLNLAYNYFNFSTISSKFAGFAKMIHLNLTDSAITGEVPSEISCLSKMISLDLFWNYGMRIETPSLEMLNQNLTKLSELVLDYVDLPLISPSSFKNLPSSLTSLHLFHCTLNGRIPDNIFHLPNLQQLDVSANYNLIGSLPKYNWSSPLISLRLSETRFPIDFSNLIKNLKSLKELYLCSCNITSPSLTIFPNLTQITCLDLSNNNFGDQIPWSVLNIERLTVLDLSGNNFKGKLPDFSIKLTQVLSSINSSKTQQVSHFPSNLEALEFSYNLLNGTIPSWLYSIPSLRSLYLSHNQFIGHIGEFHYNSLKYLKLSNNNLQGSLPMSISKLVTTWQAILF